MAVRRTKLRNTRSVAARLRTSAAEIAQRAYELFLARGGTHGRDLDDWLEAERQMNGGAPLVRPTVAARRNGRQGLGS